MEKELFDKINLNELIKDIKDGLYDDFRYSPDDTIEETLDAMLNLGIIEEFIEDKTY